MRPASTTRIRATSSGVCWQHCWTSRWPSMPYRRRLQRVLAHRLGIWDVLDACDREGSGDASIRNQKANQFARLHRLAPRLTMVAFNGQTAGRFAARVRCRGVPNNGSAIVEPGPCRALIRAKTGRLAGVVGRFSVLSRAPIARDAAKSMAISAAAHGRVIG